MSTQRLLLYTNANTVGGVPLAALEKTEWNMEIASSGQRLIHRAREARPDLIVLDLCDEMPSGLTLIEAVRSEPSTAAIPVIVVAANAEQATRRRAMELGADDWIVTPSDARTLETAIRSRLDRVRSLRAEFSRQQGTMVSLLDEAPLFIGVCDTETGRFHFINGFGRRVSGLDAPSQTVPTFSGLFAPAEINPSLPLPFDRLDSGTNWVGEVTLLRPSGPPLPMVLSLARHSESQEHGRCVTVIARDSSQRLLAETALRESEAVLRGIVDNAEEAICVLDTRGRQLWSNPSFATCMPGTAFETEPTPLATHIHPSDRPALAVAIDRACATGRSGTFEYRASDPQGNTRHFEANLCLVRDEAGDPVRLINIARDVTDRRRAEHERTMTRILLDEAQRLESIGRLASGIAHEINTPTQFVGDNLRFLKTSFADIVEILAHLEPLLEKAQSTPELSGAANELAAELDTADVPYIAEEIPASLDQSIEGIQRVANIVRAMREFSHPGSPDRAPADINRAIESTTVVAHNEWKYVADLDLELDPNLGEVPCIIGELNQVILNLIVNAAHAIGDRNAGENRGKGKITITTKRCGDVAEIRVRDTGTGIPPEAQRHLFEPFFTTKPVGRGTGQGLAIAKSVVVDRHGGEITFTTESGVGTCFVIRIPLAQPSQATAA